MQRKSLHNILLRKEKAYQQQKQKAAQEQHLLQLKEQERYLAQQERLRIQVEEEEEEEEEEQQRKRVQKIRKQQKKQIQERDRIELINSDQQEQKFGFLQQGGIDQELQVSEQENLKKSFAQIVRQNQKKLSGKKNYRLLQPKTHHVEFILPTFKPKSKVFEIQKNSQKLKKKKNKKKPASKYDLNYTSDDDDDDDDDDSNDDKYRQQHANHSQKLSNSVKKSKKIKGRPAISQKYNSSSSIKNSNKSVRFQIPIRQDDNQSQSKSTIKQKKVKRKKFINTSGLFDQIDSIILSTDKAKSSASRQNNRQSIPSTLSKGFQTPPRQVSKYQEQDPRAVQESPKFKSPFSRPPSKYHKKRNSQFYEFSEQTSNADLSQNKRPNFQTNISAYNNDTMTINNSTTMINPINIDNYTIGKSERAQGPHIQGEFQSININIPSFARSNNQSFINYTCMQNNERLLAQYSAKKDQKKQQIQPEQNQKERQQYPEPHIEKKKKVNRPIQEISTISPPKNQRKSTREHKQQTNTTTQAITREENPTQETKKINESDLQSYEQKSGATFNKSSQNSNRIAIFENQGGANQIGKNVINKARQKNRINHLQQIGRVNKNLEDYFYNSKQAAAIKPTNSGKKDDQQQDGIDQELIQHNSSYINFDSQTRNNIHEMRKSGSWNKFLNSNQDLKSNLKKKATQKQQSQDEKSSQQLSSKSMHSCRKQKGNITFPKEQNFNRQNKQQQTQRKNTVEITPQKSINSNLVPRTFLTNFSQKSNNNNNSTKCNQTTSNKSIKSIKKSAKRNKVVERGNKNMKIDQFFFKNSSSDFKKPSSILEDCSVASRHLMDHIQEHGQVSDEESNSCRRQSFRKDISESIVKKITWQKQVEDSNK